MTELLSTARTALRHYRELEGVALSPFWDHPALVSPLGDGLINDTFLVEVPHNQESYRAVLQRVNPLFGIAVHQDIEAITRHLQRRGLVTPVLLRTSDDQLAVNLGEAGVWRVLRYIPGQTFAKMTPQLAAPAASLVARFHAAVSDLDHRFHFVRSGAHDFAKHINHLHAAVAKANEQTAIPDGFLALADSICALADQIPIKVPGPLRICHGDLKLSNLRFDDHGQGLCLLDLDTLAHLQLGHELGDALRSWCNPLGEDRTDAYFDLGLLHAAMAGYASAAKSFITVEEREFLITAALRITVQLAARFAADIIYQSYFRYDPSRFPSRAAHNQVRAHGQLALAHSIVQQRRQAESIVTSAFAAA
ncbi:MAG: aminoglycoside phosphotransferase family protein [Myxococcales bacterium]|nr:aminoglycoside phosphotransferase family protein [Myxococcales bacterium]